MIYWLYCIILLTFSISVKAGLSIRDSDSGGYAVMDIYPVDNALVTDVQIGSNKQPITLQISHNFADSFVSLPNVTCSPHYEDYAKYSVFGDNLQAKDVQNNSNCTQFGTFDPSQSTSFYREPSKGYFVVFQEDNFGFAGIWGQDVVKFNDELSLSNMTLSVALSFNRSKGILGLGPTWLELKSLSGEKEYPNLLKLLVAQNITERSVYSIYMNNPEATNGTVLFGAVDYSKFDYLETQPIDARLASQYEFGLTCNKVEFENNQTNVNKTVTKKAMPVRMRYDYPLSEFPVSILKPLVGHLGGTYNSSSRSQEVSCDFLNDTANAISFKFGNEYDKIEFPVADIIEQQDDKCMLTIIKSEEKYPLITFGMDLLAGLYLVYDMERFEISLGITQFDDSPANISVITKKTAKGPLDNQVNRAALSMASSGYSGATFAFILSILISLLFW